MIGCDTCKLLSYGTGFECYCYLSKALSHSNIYGLVIHAYTFVYALTIFFSSLSFLFFSFLLFICILSLSFLLFFFLLFFISFWFLFLSFCYLSLSFFYFLFFPFLLFQDPKHIPVFVTMLLNHRNEQLRLKVIKLMADIMCSPNVPEGNRSCWHLRAIGLSALTEHLAADVSEPLVKRLLTLAVSEHDESKGVGVLLHYHVVMAVIELIHNEGVETKLLVSHMVCVGL